MTWTKTGLVSWVLVVATFITPVALAAPPGYVQKCADPAFRQTHLSECNLQESPGLGLGGGSGSGKGLLGTIGGIIHDATGGLL